MALADGPAVPLGVEWLASAGAAAACSSPSARDASTRSSATAEALGHRVRRLRRVAFGPLAPRRSAPGRVPATGAARAERAPRRRGATPPRQLTRRGGGLLPPGPVAYNDRDSPRGAQESLWTWAIGAPGSVTSTTKFSPSSTSAPRPPSQIGDLKRRQDAPSYVPEREAAILRSSGRGESWSAVRAGGDAPCGARSCRRAARSRSPLTVAYLGPPATFTHQAARASLRRIGRVSRLAARSPRSSRTSSAAARSSAWCRWRTPPTARSTSRSIAWSTPSVQICGELTLDDRAAPAVAGAATSARSSACSRIPRDSPSAAAGWPRHLPDVPVRGDDVHRGGRGAGRHRRARSPPSPPIWPAGSTACRSCAPRIEDNPQNSTRFLVIGRQAGRARPAARQDVRSSSRCATSRARSTASWSRWPAWASISPRSSPGRRDAPAVGLRHVRGSRGPPRPTPLVASALSEMAQRTLFLRVLGSYPAA